MWSQAKPFLALWLMTNNAGFGWFLALRTNSGKNTKCFCLYIIFYWLLKYLSVQIILVVCCNNFRVKKTNKKTSQLKLPPQSCSLLPFSLKITQPWLKWFRQQHFPHSSHSPRPLNVNKFSFFCVLYVEPDNEWSASELKTKESQTIFHLLPFFFFFFLYCSVTRE